jgi:hypothetical protein
MLIGILHFLTSTSLHWCIDIMLEHQFVFQFLVTYPLGSSIHLQYKHRMHQLSTICHNLYNVSLAKINFRSFDHKGVQEFYQNIMIWFLFIQWPTM